MGDFIIALRNLANGILTRKSVKCNYVVMPRLTTVQRNALTGVLPGALIENTTTGQYERRNGTVRVGFGGGLSASIVATFQSLNQQNNFPSTVIYTPPTGQGGMYRVTVSINMPTTGTGQLNSHRIDTFNEAFGTVNQTNSTVIAFNSANNANSYSQYLFCNDSGAAIRYQNAVTAGTGRYNLRVVVEKMF